MIDLVNTKNLSDAQRRASLSRAVHSQPFFNLLHFEPVLAGQITPNFAAKQQVNKDFFLTSIQGDFSQDNAVNVKARYFMSLYIAGTGDSIYRYISGEFLPASMECTQSNQTTAPGILFDDRQREFMPRFIKAGSVVVGSIKKRVALVASSNIDVVLSGYYTNPTAYLAEQTLKGVNESLADDIFFDLWKFDVTEQGNIIKVLENDRFARMVLGFQIVNKPLNGGHVSDGTMLITDIYRGIKFNNDPINIAFFAPKQFQQTLDSHITYLPIEHFWEPFSPLKFEIVNDINTTLGAGYELVMLTRTV